jgi:hypothetical protein
MLALSTEAIAHPTRPCNPTIEVMCKPSKSEEASCSGTVITPCVKTLSRRLPNTDRCLQQSREFHST